MQDCIRMTLVVSRGRTKEIQIVRTKEHSTNDKRKKNLTFILCDEMKCLWGLAIDLCNFVRGDGNNGNAGMR